MKKGQNTWPFTDYIISTAFRSLYLLALKDILALIEAPGIKRNPIDGAA